MRMLRATLILTTCLLLAMPTGWCCIFTLTTPATAQTAKANADCCSSCCPPEQPSQDEAPPPRAPMTWCCCENTVPLREGTVKVFPGAMAAVLPAVEASPAPTIHFDRATAELCLSPPRALHVLQCLWLC